ncbi:MAG TPA: alpha/beta hydrolase [Longimicrobiales bacterium]
MRRTEVWVGGRRARYIDAGAGPPVVFVHGLGLSGAVFRGHCRAFAAAGFRPVAPDLPGFGRSRGPRLGLSVPETASWLLAFAAAVGLGPVVWIGHSLAAQAVLEAAVRAPARARALVLVTPTGAPGSCRLLRQVRSFARDIGREPLSLVPVVARQYMQGSLGAFLGTWLRATRDHPSRKARRVQCPTLVVAGKRDPVVPNDFVEILVRRIPDVRLARIHGAGHAITFDRSDDFDREVLAFLRGVIGGAAPAPGPGAG